MATPASNVQGLTGNPYIDGLVQGGAWQFGGGARTLTYSLNINDSESSPGVPIGGTWAQYPAIADAVNRAFAEWANVIDVTFVSTGTGGIYYDSTADMAVTLAGDDLVANFEAAALGFFPDPVFGDLIRASWLELSDPPPPPYNKPEGDLFFDNYLPAFGASNLSDGGLGFTYILHEIGHALGLKHPDDDGQNERPTFTQLGIAALDTPANTLMGQPSIFDDGNQSSGHVATPMPLDILAIQTLYGANTSYNAGDTTYFLSLDGAWRTIWDAGGTDVLDASGLDPVSHLTFDLRPGAISELEEGTAVAIAYNVIIENFVGTVAGDTVHGNDAANILDGGSGEGADLQGDTMYGHGGNDTFIVDSLLDSIVESASEGTDRITTSLSYVLPANVEILLLTGSASVNGTGNTGDNWLIGNVGNNTLSGGEGNDTLEGGGGTDQLVGGAGNDTYIIDGLEDGTNESVGGGTDTIETAVSLYLRPNFENLTLTGTAAYGVGSSGNNVLMGNDQENLLIGHAGNDTLDGGAARDSLFGMDDGDTLYGGSGIDYLVGGNGNDTIYGGNDADEAYGEDGSDLIYGGDDFATDILVGGAGNDTIDGGQAWDLMYGGAGDDTFYVSQQVDWVFEQPGEGTDTVIADSPNGYYLYANIENLELAGVTSFGVGNELANALTGNAVTNLLLGGSGNDRLNGKGGNDVLFGEGGADTFVFERGTGGDVIGDFAPGTDKIELSGVGYASYAQVQSHLVENGGTAAIDLGAGDFVVINGVGIAQLSATDFIFI